MVKAWLIGTAILLAPVMASAQVPRQADAETIRARQKISLVEGSFERAVQNAADNFSRQVQAVVPGADGMAMLLGAPVVRGFRQRGGIFFDVLMPSLQLSMAWPLRYSQGADPATLAALADVRNSLERSVADPQERQALTQKLRQLEMQMSPARNAGGRRPGPTPVSNLQATTGAVPPPSPVESGIMDDPAEAWRSEVRGALIDAILDIPASVSIGAEDYITVAARGVLSPDRLVADPGDSRTIELSLKGSDLDAYRSKAITLEDVHKRVGVREY